MATCKYSTSSCAQLHVTNVHSNAGAFSRFWWMLFKFSHQTSRAQPEASFFGECPQKSDQHDHLKKYPAPTAADWTAMSWTEPRAFNVATLVLESAFWQLWYQLQESTVLSNQPAQLLFHVKSTKSSLMQPNQTYYNLRITNHHQTKHSYLDTKTMISIIIINGQKSA